MMDGKTLDFIVCAGWRKSRRTEGTPEEVDAALEETEFTTWPPTSGNVRFFL